MLYLFWFVFSWFVGGSKCDSGTDKMSARDSYSSKPIIFHIFRYFKSQWAMPISKNFELYDLFNYQIMKIKESGILHFIRQSYGDGGMTRKCESTNDKREPQ